MPQAQANCMCHHHEALPAPVMRRTISTPKVLHASSLIPETDCKYPMKDQAVSAVNRIVGDIFLDCMMPTYGIFEAGSL